MSSSSLLRWWVRLNEEQSGEEDGRALLEKVRIIAGVEKEEVVVGWRKKTNLKIKREPASVESGPTHTLAFLSIVSLRPPIFGSKISFLA